MSEHYSTGRRWSDWRNAWILEDSWTDRDTIAGLETRLASAESELAAVRQTRDSHEQQLARIAKLLGRDARHSTDGTIAGLVESDRADLRSRLTEAEAVIREVLDIVPLIGMEEFTSDYDRIREAKNRAAAYLAKHDAMPNQSASDKERK